MKIIFFVIGVMFFINASSASEEITPYKFTDEERSGSMPTYVIPESSRFTVKRLEVDAPDIVYYLSKPQVKMYQIAMMCGGSSSKEDIGSIIHFHRYFLRELTELDVGVLTLEQWGVDGEKVDVKEFMEHYTRSQRLQDHQTVIEHLKLNPPIGWNGKLVFLGVSGGGPLVTTLTQEYQGITLATINWSGAGDWSWREELWKFLQKLLLENPAYSHDIKLDDCPTCSEAISLRDRYDACMDATLENPTADRYFFNMPYKYHADAQQYPAPDYHKIRTPFLVVTGAQDSFIQSSDAFVAKAKGAGNSITYLRVPDMDHYVRKRPDIVQESFKWLEGILGVQRF